MSLFNKTRPRARAAVFAAVISVTVAAGAGGAYLAGQALAERAQAAKPASMTAVARPGSNVATQQSATVTPSPGLLHRTAFEASAPFQIVDASGAQRDLDCLTAAVYYEARGENPAGQAAVAQVVLNRVRHPAFPKTVCGVVYQGAAAGACQFSFACDGAADRQREPEAWARARSVAERALSGYVMTGVGHATHFHIASLDVDWGGQMIRVAQVGQHVFYAFGGGRRIAAPRIGASQALAVALPPSPAADGVALAVAGAAATAPALKPADDVSADHAPASTPTATGS